MDENLRLISDAQEAAAQKRLEAPGDAAIRTGGFGYGGAESPRIVRDAATGAPSYASDHLTGPQPTAPGAVNPATSAPAATPPAGADAFRVVAPESGAAPADPAAGADLSRYGESLRPLAENALARLDGVEHKPSAWSQDLNNLFGSLRSVATRAADRLSQGAQQPPPAQQQQQRQAQEADPFSAASTRAAAQQGRSPGGFSMSADMPDFTASARQQAAESIDGFFA